MNSLEEFWGEFRIERLVETNQILLFHVVAGMRKLLRQLTAVGHHDEAGAVVIEPPDIVETAELFRNQFVNGLASFGVVSCAEILDWLVEDQGERRLLLKEFSIKTNMVVGKDSRAQINNDLPIDLDSTFTDERLATSSRSDIAGRQKTVETNTLIRLCAHDRSFPR
jgi:hypothetical protein